MAAPDPVHIQSGPLVRFLAGEDSDQPQLAELRLRVSRVIVAFGWVLALSMPLTWLYHPRWPWSVAAAATAASLVLCLGASLWLRANPWHPLQRFIGALTIDTVGVIWVVISGGSDAPDINPILVAIAAIASFAAYGCRRVLMLFIVVSAAIVLLAQLYFPDLWMVEGANWGRTCWFLAIWISTGVMFFALAGQIQDVLLGQVRSQAELAAIRRQEEHKQRAIEAEEAARRQSEMEAMQRKAEADARTAAEHDAFTTAITGVLARLTDGDLTGRLTQPLAPEYEKVRADFNAMLERWGGEMLAVTGAANAIRGGAGEISGATDDLARRSEQQAASLAATAAELGEITTRVKRTAEGVGQANRVVAATQQDAAGGREIVARAVEAMGRIENSSRRIGDIIGVIDEIAFQTNLLALNAGVEAARAGDSGKGFAVVASEVRALAQRSADAAKEIKTLISTSTAHVGEGVELVAKTGGALERIGDKVAEITRVVAEIAVNAGEQASGLQQVNAAVGEMDGMTQSSAASVEETAAASHGLAAQADELAKLVSRYRLDEAKASDLRQHLRAAAPHAFRAPSRPPTGGRAPAPVRAVAGGGGRENWEEF